MFSISHEQTRSKVFCFQNVDALFPRITFSDYFVRNGDMHQHFEKDAGYFFQNKLFVTLSGQPKNNNNNNLWLLHSVKTLHGLSGSD